ncbi:hypothetical protein SNEBB_003770 [Seison nebaliae]|nr:hypothetical protein SNEBB_003770 [Seison nebaliae]
MSFGLFQWIVLAVCGCINACDAVEIISISYILPVIECDLNFDPKAKAYSLTLLFIGMMIGGFVWGLLADIFGRKRMLMSTLVVNAFFTLISAFPTTYTVFCLLRFCAGMGIGGNIPIIWGYFTEFLPTKQRAKMLCLLACFWYVGALYVACAARLILAHSIHISFMANWRFFMLICSVPSFLAIITFFPLPESGMFISKQSSDETYKIKLSQQIKKFNESNSFKRKFIIYRQMSKLEDYTQIIPKSIIYQKLNLKNVINQIIQLFSKTYRKSLVLIVIVSWTISFAFYGLWMWLPHLFRRMELNGGHICAPLSNSSSNMTDHKIRCQIDDAEIRDTLLSVLGGIPGNVFAFVFVNRIDRRKFLMFSFFITTVIISLLPFIHASIQGVIIMNIFSTIAAIIFNVLATVQTELFPTQLRTTAIGFIMIFLRLSSIVSNLVFSLFIESHCSLSILSISGTCVVAILASYLLPETRNKILI